MRILIMSGIGLAACLSAPEAWACSCKKPTPSFLDVARQAEVVVVAEVTRNFKVRPDRPEAGSEVRVLEVVKGRETRQVISLVGRSSSNCEVVLMDLAIGDRYAIVLSPGDPNEGVFNVCRPRIKRIVDQAGFGPGGLTIEELRTGLQR